MRKLIATGVAAVAAALALVPAANAQAGTRCTDPARSYTVVVADGVSCSYAKRFSAEYTRRYVEAYSDPDYYGPPPSRVWGWGRVATGGGTYFGLYGTKTVWRRDSKTIQIYSRGE